MWGEWVDGFDDYAAQGTQLENGDGAAVRRKREEGKKQEQLH